MSLGRAIGSSIGSAIGSALAWCGATSNGLATGLVNFWALDEASGNRVNTERSLPFVETGGAVGTRTGLRGSGHAALLSIASPNYLRTAETGFGLTGDPFTKAVWVYVVSAPDSYYEVYGCHSTGSANNYDIIFFVNYSASESEIDVDTFRQGGTGKRVRDPATQNLNWATVEGAWHLLVWGHDGTNMFYQRNAGTRIVYEDATALPTAVADARFALGDALYSQAYNPNCAFQFLAHWNRALSESEVTALYNGGQGLTREEMT